MNIYQKLSEAKLDFHSKEIKKSGHNKFAGYKYFELGDFIKPAMESLNKNGLVAFVSFENDKATLTVREFDGDGVIVISSPMVSVEMKGANAIQALGAVQTYIRRYLWTSLLDIIENDAVDAQEPQSPQDNLKKLIELAAKDGIAEATVKKYISEKGLTGKEINVINNYDKALVTLKKIESTPF